jgi:hypothetical protein
MARTTDQPASAPHRRIASTDLPYTLGYRPMDEQGQDDGGNRETGDYREAGDNPDNASGESGEPDENRGRREQGQLGERCERGLLREPGWTGEWATSQGFDPERETSFVAYLWHRFGPGGQQRRSQERDLRADQVDAVQEIAWSWRKACEGAGLSEPIQTPSGQSVGVPRVGRITLGPPTTITLQPRPGQTRERIAALGPSLAASMGVSEIRVWDLAPAWVTVELVRTPGDRRAGADPSHDDGHPFPAPPPFADLDEPPERHAAA